MKPLTKTERLALEAEAREQQSASSTAIVADLRQRIASLEAENAALVETAADEAQKLTNAYAAITRARKACSEWKTSYKTERNKRLALHAMIKGQKEVAE